MKRHFSQTEECLSKSIRFARFAFAFTDRLAARVSAAEARRAHIDVHLRRLIIANAAGRLYLCLLYTSQF